MVLDDKPDLHLLDMVKTYLRQRPKTIGATCDEVEDGLGMPHLVAVDAMGKLKRRGIIRRVLDESGKVYTRYTRAGGLGVVWTLTQHRY